ncbi:MAG: ATP-binding cassette domain-containing protein [Alphaproteobacteria bacterium]|nr:MAG: ATP-binding cassette domain-containing protein [Alphaproteobacteria bacterium]
MTAAPLLEAAGLTRHYRTREDIAARTLRALGLATRPPVIQALSDVAITIGTGEIVGLVGESGCGKSTLGRILAGLEAADSGTLYFKGADVGPSAPAQAPAARLKRQMIFQSPMASLNPRLTVRDIVGEAPRVHRIVAEDMLEDFVADMLRRVGLDPKAMVRRPHEFSGGQRQRIGIARALAVNPELIVCDESVAALDVSVQAQILNLLLDLRRTLGVALLFISHDLGVVQHISDRVYVMYLGRIVEAGDAQSLFDAPAHPYTRALNENRPRLATARRRFNVLTGDLPSPYAPPAGCAFHPRCPMAAARCATQRPRLRALPNGRQSACHFAEEVTHATA